MIKLKKVVRSMSTIKNRKSFIVCLSAIFLLLSVGRLEALTKPSVTFSDVRNGKNYDGTFSITSMTPSCVGRTNYRCRSSRVYIKQRINGGWTTKRSKTSYPSNARIESERTTLNINGQPGQKYEFEVFWELSYEENTCYTCGGGSNIESKTDRADSAIYTVTIPDIPLTPVMRVCDGDECKESGTLHVSDGTYTVEWELPLGSAPAASYSLYENNRPTTFPGNTKERSFSKPLSPTTSNYVYQLRADSPIGSSLKTSPVTVAVKNQRPVIESWVSPVSDQMYEGAHEIEIDENASFLNLTVAATDADSSISKVEFFYLESDSSLEQRESLGLVRARQVSNQYTHRWNLDQLNLDRQDKLNYRFDLMVEVTDSHENIASDRYPVYAYILNEPPEITLIAPSHPARYSRNNETVDIRIEASDSYGGVYRVGVFDSERSARNFESEKVLVEVFQPKNGNGYELIVDIEEHLDIKSNGSETKRQLYIAAQDNHGVTSEVIHLQATFSPAIDPTISVVPNKTNGIKVNDTVKFTVHADSSDASFNDHITLLEFRKDGVRQERVSFSDQIRVDHDFEYRFSEATTNAPASFTVYVEDSFGGSRESVPIDIQVAPRGVPSNVKLKSVEGYEQAISATQFLDIDGDYSVRWNESATAASEGVFEYKMEVTAPGGGKTYPTFRPGQYLNETNVSRSGVYQYRLKAVNALGESPSWSPAFFVNVQSGVPAAPDITVTEIKNSINGDNAGDFTLSWNHTSDNFLEYTYILESREYRELDQNNEGLPWESSPRQIPTTHYRFQNEAAGKYEYRVRACNIHGCTPENEAGKQVVVEIINPFLSVKQSCGENCLAVAANSVHVNAKLRISSMYQETLYQEFTGLKEYWNESKNYFELPINDDVQYVLDELNSIHIELINASGVVSATTYNATDNRVHLAHSASSYAGGPEGTLYVGHGHKLYAVNPGDGTEQQYGDWPFETAGEIVATPVVDMSTGNVFIGSKDDFVYGIDSAGFRIWSVGTEGDVLSTGVLDDDKTLYFGSMSGNLFSVQSETGIVNWAYPAGKPIPYSPALSGENGDSLIYYTTEDGQTQAIGRGGLGDGQLQWNIEENRDLSKQLLEHNWIPFDEDEDEFAMVARLYIAILQSQNDESGDLEATLFFRDVLTYWTYAAVLRANLEEIAAAFLDSNETLAIALKGVVANGTDERFLDTMYYRVFGDAYLEHLELSRTDTSIGEFTIHYGGEPYTRNDLLFLLASGQSREWMITLFTESQENSADNYLISEYFDLAYNTAKEQILAVLNCNLDTPHECDKDNDGISDYWEIVYFGSIEIVNAPDLDSNFDEDGLTLRDEILLGDSPCEGGCSDGVAAQSETPAEKGDGIEEDYDDAKDKMDQVGAIAAVFNVNESGAATYTVPLLMPEGTAGVAPEVALSYNSQGGNGLLGQGWNISGLSSIHRCKQTLWLDGQARPITWGEEDRFCMNGARLLVEKGDVYGGVGAKYRTEIDGLVYITSHGGEMGKPDYFTVESKDGTLSYYGQAGGSKDTAGNEENAPVLSWNISRFEDTAENGVNFVYEKTGGHSIRSIQYAYGSDSKRRAEIRFNYDGRPDPQGGYVGGYDFMTTKRLSSIDVLASAPAGELEQLRKYSLNYIDPSNTTYPTGTAIGNISRIHSIIENRAGIDLPETVFQWELFYAGFGSSPLTEPLAVSTPEDNKVVTDFSPADVNGDGRMDFVWQESKFEGRKGTKITNTEFKVVLGSESGFEALPEAFAFNTGADTYTPWPMQVVDYNADGRGDLVYFNGDDDLWYVHFAEPQNNGANRLWSFSDKAFSTGVKDVDARFVDLNSDGLIDVLTASFYRLMEKNTSPSQPGRDHYILGEEIEFTIRGLEDWVPDTEDTDPATHTFTYHTYVSPDAFGDFNGDGRMDIVVIDTEALWYDSSASGCGSCGALEYQHSRFYVTTIEGPNENSRLQVMDKVLDFKQSDGFISRATLQSNSSNRLRHGDLYNKLKAQDINADGIADLIFEYEKHALLPGNISGLPETEDLRDEDDYNIHTFRLGDGSSFHQEQFIRQLREKARPQFVDINFDGNTDIVWSSWHKTTGALVAELWNGDGFDDYTELRDLWENGQDDTNILIDMTGDGRLDHLHYNNETIDYFLALNDGAPLNLVTEITNGLGAKTEIEYGTMVDSELYSRLEVTFVDSEECFEADRGNFRWIMCDDIRVPEAKTYYDRLYGNWDYQSYWPVDTVDPTPGQDLSKPYPILEVMAPVPLVKRASSTAPAVGANGDMDYSASSAVSYHYHQQQMQAAGRGNLGFKSVSSFDEQSRVNTTTYYRQDYPYIGLPLSTRSGHVDPVSGEIKLISESANVWSQADRSLSESAPQDSILPYVETSVEISYNIDATEESVKQRVTTENNPPDEYGNHTSIIVTTEGGGDVLVKETTANHGLDLNLTGFSNTERRVLNYAALGRLVSSTVTHKRTGDHYSGEHIARASSFSYYTNGKQAGLLHTETVEDGYELKTGESPLTQTTTYSYDELGNQTQVDVTGLDLNRSTLTRTTKAVYEVGGGRYPDKNISVIYNADEAGDAVEIVTEEVVSRNAYGSPLEVKDINGNISTYTYTGAGEQYEEYSPAGVTSVKLRVIPGSVAFTDDRCPANVTAFEEWQFISGGVHSIECFDVLGRRIRVASETFGGETWAYVDTKYDSSGRSIATSLPHTGTASAWSEVEYDDFGRVIFTHAPDDTVESLTATTSITYDGFTTVTTNPLGQVKTEVHNAYGEILSSAQGDDETGTTTVSYHYNQQGNLTQTQINDDPETTVTIAYDNVGRKIEMDDPDKGRWIYKYNAFGELRRQTDAKGQVIESEYDSLGRMVERRDKTRAFGRYSRTRNLTKWTFNNALDEQPGSGIGALLKEEETISGFMREYTYDSLGRSDAVTTTLPEDEGGTSAHYQRTTYDKYGRIHQLFDAAGNGSWSDSVALHRYNERGFLVSVSDGVTLNGVSRNGTYYEVLSMDIRGNITQERHAGRHTTSKSYYPLSGRIESITTNATGSILDDFVVQSQTYVWDAIGNLKSREDDTDAQNRLTETFIYDDLNRLKSAAITGGETTTVDYDALGNITYKSDVGHYYYGNQCEGNRHAGVHAVCGLSDGTTFDYDANGNLRQDSERDFSYSIFDKVTNISKADGTQVDFAYGSDRSRYQRTDVQDGKTKRTQYIGNVEKITYIENGEEITEIKRYIGDTLITQKRNSFGEIIEQKTQFMLKDHLGSLSRLIDYDEGSAGNFTAQSFSFDPWGQRRNTTDWSRLNTFDLADFDTSITTRGFTGHEMVDSVGIIHMNGRIYDPRLGRFLQADPFVDGVSNGQGFNRYSYLHNNPLNGTDPTGYLSARQVFGIVAVAVISYATYGMASKFGLALYGSGCVSVCTIATAKVMSAAIGGIAAGFAAGVASAAISGAGLSDSIKAGFRGAIYAGMSVGAFSAIGASGMGLIGKSTAHAFAGGVLNHIQGGKFGHGFVSAGLTKLANVNSIGTNDTRFAMRAIRVTLAGILGGAISEITGGKFANGALTAALGQALNGESVHDEDAPEGGFGERFQKITGMSVEDSISLYKSQTGETLTVDQVQKMFTDPSYAKEMLLANENLHKIYRNDILNSNAPQSIADAKARDFVQLPVYKSVFHNPWYNPWRNSKWVGPSGHMEVVFSGKGSVVSDIKYMGTFNFFGPDQASAHWAADVEPYQKWGN